MLKQTQSNSLFIWALHKFKKNFENFQFSQKANNLVNDFTDKIISTY